MSTQQVREQLDYESKMYEVTWLEAFAIHLQCVTVVGVCIGNGQAAVEHVVVTF